MNGAELWIERKINETEQLAQCRLPNSPVACWAMHHPKSWHLIRTAKKRNHGVIVSGGAKGDCKVLVGLSWLNINSHPISQRMSWSAKAHYRNLKKKISVFSERKKVYKSNVNCTHIRPSIHGYFLSSWRPGRRPRPIPRSLRDGDSSPWWMVHWSSPKIQNPTHPSRLRVRAPSCKWY